MRIVESKTVGSLTHCTWEMLIGIVYDIDEPMMAIQAGEQAFVRGVAVQEWQWEGEGDTWNGSLADDAVKGWKIVRENDYMVPLKARSEGSSVGMFE